MYGRMTQAALRLEHRHSDGTWSALERVHRDPSDHDPERDWAKGHLVFSCTTCDEMVRITDPGAEPGATEPV